MTALTEKLHTGEYILSEGEGNISREVVTLISGQNLYPGTVLGQITASKKYTQLDPSAGDGSEEAAAILYDHVDASAGDTDAVITARLTEVKGPALTWPDTSPEVDLVAAYAELATHDIIVRD